MKNIVNLWRNHSLSIVCCGSGLLVMGVSAYVWREGTWFDLISGVGQGVFGAGVYGFMKGPLVEVNEESTTVNTTNTEINIKEDH